MTGSRNSGEEGKLPIAVTVLMPVYNAGRYLKNAIDSILAQSYKEFEFLIINDGSTDDSAALIKSYDDSRIRLVETGNQGVAKTLALGIDLARGKYIARMDADDVALPDRLQIQKDILDHHADVAVVHGRVDYIDGVGKVIKKGMGDMRSDVHTRWDLIWHNVPFHATIMLRADVLRNNSLNYRAEMDLAEDYDLWNRVALVGGFFFVPEVVLRYRIHSNSVTRGDKAARQLQIQGRVTRENFAHYGIVVNDDCAKELAVLAGSTPIHPAAYKYRCVTGILPRLQDELAERFCEIRNVEARRLIDIRAEQLIQWARAFLPTSRALAVKLLANAIRIAPRKLARKRVWLLLAAVTMPKRVLDSITSKTQNAF